VTDKSHRRFRVVRLHGPTKFKYQESYRKSNHLWQKEKKDVYVYFDNDQGSTEIKKKKVVCSLITYGTFCNKLQKDEISWKE
jgi:uncharacterized protein YecE (DUF72 family)